MKIIINEDILDEYNLNLKEFLYLLLLESQFSEEDVDSLVSKGYLPNGKYTNNISHKVGDILNSMKEEPSTDSKIELLADKLMNIFPQGKKPGTPYYWKGNKKEIRDKLKKFYVYFGDQYTEEQIISATKKYVESFNGDYSYMRLLKYFIWKNDVKRNCSSSEKLAVEQISDLATYIENEDQDNVDTDWTSTLV